jgi:hypothetical protein
VIRIVRLLIFPLGNFSEYYLSKATSEADTLVMKRTLAKEQDPQKGFINSNENEKSLKSHIQA